MRITGYNHLVYIQTKPKTSFKRICFAFLQNIYKILNEAQRLYVGRLHHKQNPLLKHHEIEIHSVKISAGIIEEHEKRISEMVCVWKITS